MKYQTQLEPLCVATTQLLPDAFLQTSQGPSCRHKSSIPGETFKPLAGMLRCASQLPEFYSKTCENKQSDIMIKDHQRWSNMTALDATVLNLGSLEGSRWPDTPVHFSGCGTTWRAWEIPMGVGRALSVAPSTMACGVSVMSRRWRWDTGKRKKHGGTER